WATHARIERMAREELGMVVPGAEQLLVVKP
ncbi:MAG: cell division protein FtsL, partial [Gammaproteobacteria bacterium]